MYLDNGVEAITQLYAEHMTSRKVDIIVSQEDLSKQKVQYIIDLVKNQPKYDDHDLETKNVIFHQSIGYFKQLKSRNQLTDDELETYPHLQPYLKDSKGYSAKQGLTRGFMDPLDISGRY